MEAITTGMGVVSTAVGDVFTMISGNPLLAAFAASGLIGVAIGVYSAIKNAAR